MNEHSIKAKVLDQLRNQGRITDNAIIANEFVLGRSACRADLAILSTEFLGVEIKSEKDSLKRLQSQIDIYCKHFDSVLLVVATKHLRSLPNYLYGQVELWEVGPSGDLSSICSRPATKPPKCNYLLNLLTQAEIRKYRISIEKNESSMEKVFAEVFKKRFENTSALFWRAVDGCEINPSSIGILSRFKQRRNSVNTWREAQAASWQHWAMMMQNAEDEVFPSD